MMKQVLKGIYTAIPFKKEIFTAIKKVWSPKESIFQHLYFTGVIDVPVTKGKSFKIKHYGFQVENEIFWTGLTNGWEKESLKIWIELSKQSDVVFDIGANTGVFGLVTKSINPSAKVYAFEPVNRVFEKLQENIKLNNYDIVAVEKAPSNFDGEATIYDTPSEHTYSVTVNKNFLSLGDNVVETKIQTITLNSFIKQNKISKIDLMKIDVETHEPEVFEGFSEYLQNFRPTMIVEIINDEVGKKVEELTAGLGYEYYSIDENVGAKKETSITSSGRYVNYLICSPQIAKRLNY